jgi:tRNA threonylcarbamoyladenosine biosynthesis protein TsaB
MTCLAVNTATKTLSLALVNGDKTLHLFEAPETRDQGNVLMGHIQEGLKANHIGFSDLDLLAVVIGPGSFTGIRVGLAAMRGIALAAQKPLIGITSFDMFAVPVHDALNIVVIESWREELFFAVLDEESHPMMECMNETPEVFFHRFQQTFPGTKNVVLSGDAAPVLMSFFPEAEIASPLATAVDVARLALQKFKKGGVFPRPVPYYLREADVTISSRPAKKLKENT